MTSMKKRLLSIALSFCLLLTFIPTVASAEEPKTMDFGEFLKAVAAANYNYDGKGVTVRWEPSSACTNTVSGHKCLFGEEAPKADGNTPQRLQEPNLQYQIFDTQTDISISNVNFEFVPKEITLCANTGWKGQGTAEQYRNAEMQLLNTGDVTFTNCNFDKVIVSPFSSTTTSTFTECHFKNVYNAYALKDVHSANLIVSSCTFDTCGGGIYLEGSTAKKQISITENTFTNIDTYAAQDKQDTRGLIQFSAAGDYSNARVTISENTSTGSAAILRQLNNSVTAAVVDTDAIAANNTFDSKAPMFVGGTSLKENSQIYVNSVSGNDSGGDGSETKPFKTISGAISKANAGDTILVSGSIGHNFFNGITKPVTIQGQGTEKVAVTGGVTLPANVNGTVKLSNFSFNGTSTIGLYGTSTEYAGLDLVIENCAFTNASGNCVYIGPQINSLTVDNCKFTAPQDETKYQKQYLIWPYAAKTVTVTGSTFDGRNVIRSAIHLGEGHPEGTTALIEENTFKNFERGIQLAFTNSKENTVTINRNDFKNISLAPNTLSASYEVGTVFVHENLDKNGATTKVAYTNNFLTGTSERIAYSENSTVSADKLFTQFTGNTIQEQDAGDLEDNWFDAFVAQIGDSKFKTLDAAMEAAKSMSGKVTITLLADVDYTSTFSQTAGASNTISFDLSTASGLTGLTILGANQDVKIITGVDGNNIDGANGGSTLPYCPKITVKLPENAVLTVDNLTFPNDLQFDSDGGTVVVQNCVFNGSISGYPQAKKISYLKNTFEFKGTASKFYTNNAYPVWYKSDGELDFVFDGNTVIGYRGVHIETRSSESSDYKVNIAVDNNHFTLKDDDNSNKAIALQLVKYLNGEISFKNNYVDGYMAVCFFKDLDVVEGAQLTVENNYLTNGCKLYGSSEWNQNSIAESDTFAENIIQELTGGSEESQVTPGHTTHNYVNGVCTICGERQPSGGGVSGYTVTVLASENGSVEVSSTQVDAGSTVTLTVTPDKGYMLSTVTVKDAAGNTVAVTEQNGKYVFTMPDSAVTVSATFKPEVSTLPFTDVDVNDWFYEAVEYVYENGIMAGTSATTFEPSMELNRAQAVQMLYNLEGQPEVTGECPFTDVAATHWAIKAITWGAENNVVAGMGQEQYAPNDLVTREQFAQMLYNYAKYKGYDLTAAGDLSQFPDADGISTWAEVAMAWANGKGLINGHADSGLIDPQGTALRSQAASIVANFHRNVIK